MQASFATPMVCKLASPTGIALLGLTLTSSEKSRKISRSRPLDSLRALSPLTLRPSDGVRARRTAVHPKELARSRIGGDRARRGTRAQGCLDAAVPLASRFVLTPFDTLDNPQVAGDPPGPPGIGTMFANEVPPVVFLLPSHGAVGEAHLYTPRRPTSESERRNHRVARRSGH